MSDKDHNNTSNTGKLKRIIWFIIRVSIAVTIVSLLIMNNKKDLIITLQRIRFNWILYAFGLYMLHLLFGAWRWKILIEIQKIKISFFETLSLVMQGFFFSLVIPGGAIGGDLIKVGLLASRTPKGSKTEAAFSILIDRVIGMIALFSLVLLAALFSIERINTLEGFLKNMALSIIVACLAGIVATLLLYFHRSFERIEIIAKLLKTGDRISKGTITRLYLAMDLYRNSWKTLLKCVILSILGIHLNLVFIVMLIIKGMNGQISSVPGIMFCVTFALVASLLPITPAGLGPREFVMKGLFIHIGLSAGIATAVPLVFSSFIVIFNLTGGLFFLFQPKAKIKQDNNPDLNPEINSG